MKNHGNMTVESIAQGVGNFLSGWTSGIGGCGMIGET